MLSVTFYMVIKEMPIQNNYIEIIVKHTWFIPDDGLKYQIVNDKNEGELN